MEHRKRIEVFRPSPWPEDFPQRLGRLSKLPSLSWEEFAERLGIEDDHMTEWRTGTIPKGGEVWHILRLALSVPDGFMVMLPEAAEHYRDAE